VWSNISEIIKVLSVIALVGVAINLVSNVLNNSDSVNTNYKFINESPLQREYNYNTGKADSKVTYVVFDDYQCPACKQYNSTKKEVFGKYSDKVNIVRKHNPLSEIHTSAILAGRAVQAAKNQDKFNEFGDAVFENQDKLNNSFLETVAKDQGLDVDKWNSDREIRKQVEQDQEDLKNIYLPKSSIDDKTKPVGQGIGTPTSVILLDNEVYDWYSGVMTADQISKILDDALAGVEREVLKENK
jgi:protein-disulfide isomerase